MKLKHYVIRLIHIFLVLVLMLLTTGCWDSVDLEKRGLVISVGIDKFHPSDKTGQDEQKIDDYAVKDNDKDKDKNNNKENSDEKKYKGVMESNENNHGADYENESPEKETASIGIDDGTPQDSRYTVSMALPNLENLTAGKGEGSKQIIKKTDNETVAAAIRNVDSHSNQKLYFGQTRVCLFGEELLSDSGLLREALDSLERNRDVSRKIILLAVDGRAEDMLDADLKGNPVIGIFISNFYNNNSNAVAETFKLDLESFIRELRATGNGMIPKIKIESGELKLGGAAIIKDFKLDGWLNDEQLRGYLWFRGDASGAEINAGYEGDNIPIRIMGNKSHVSLYEEDTTIKCKVEVYAEGSIEEYKIDNHSTLFSNEKLQSIQTGCEQIIAEELLKSHRILRDDFHVDAYGFKEHLRKFNYDLYLKYSQDWDSVYSRLEIIPYVKVIIRNTGSIK